MRNIEGRRVSLRPIAPADIDWLWDLLSHPAVLPWWRFRGVMPGPDRFQEALWTGVNDQRIITGRDGRRVGLATAYATEVRAHHTHAAFAIHPDAQAEMWALEGALLFFDHLFATFPLRKIYVEVTEKRTSLQLGPGPLKAAFQLEGVLREFVYENGGLTDLYVYAATRERFQEAARALI